jgi:uncharacterized lipoprotein YajG
LLFLLRGFDAFNNSLGSVAAALSIPSGAGGSVSGNSLSATKAGTWPVKVSSGSVSATVPLKVDPGSAVGFSVSSDDPKPEDGSVAATVTAKDAYGNIVTNYNGTVKLASNESDLKMPTNVTLTNGVGAFNATTKSLNTPSITATDIENASLAGSKSGPETPTTTPKSSPTEEPASRAVSVSVSEIAFIPILPLVLLFLWLGVRYEKSRLLINSRKLRALSKESINISGAAEIATSDARCIPEQIAAGEVTSRSSTKRTHVKRNLPILKPASNNQQRKIFRQRFFSKMLNGNVFTKKCGFSICL